MLDSDGELSDEERRWTESRRGVRRVAPGVAGAGGATEDTTEHFGHLAEPVAHFEDQLLDELQASGGW